MNWKLLSAIVLTAALIGALWWREHTAAQRLQAELSAAKAQLSELEKLRAELDRLAAENRHLQANAVDPNELARLRAAVTDLNRLKAEKAALEKKLTDAEAARARMAKAAEANTQKSVVLELPRIKPGDIKSRGEATVGPSQSAIAGGWVLPDGRRGVAMMTPKEIIQSDGSRLIELEARIIAVPEASLSAAGLDWLLDPAQGSGVVQTAEMAATLRSMNRNGGMEVLSAPKVTTLNGRQTQIMIQEEKGDPFTLDFMPETANENGQVNFKYTITTGLYPIPIKR